ncbi:kinesin-like protein KIN-14S [Wolffia australiana]
MSSLQELFDDAEHWQGGESLQLEENEKKSATLLDCDEQSLVAAGGTSSLLEDHQSEEKTQEGEGEKTSTAHSHEQDRISSMIQMLNDGNFIQLELFDVSQEACNPSSHLSHLHLLGTKYNALVQKWQKEKALKESLEAKNEILLRRNIEIWAERKRLYNEIIEMKGNIRVFCRCRPISSEELAKGSSMVVEFDPAQDAELQIISSENLKKQFKFDHVFSPQATQENIFAEVKPVVKSALDGFNVCIFAYGQTGTGKTFTMEGTPNNRGVNYRTLEELFKVSEERSSMMRYEFLVSMLEVYNERIRDLLTDNSNLHPKKLEVKQAAEGTQEVPGLVEAQASTIDGIWELLKTGARNRSVGSTAANELSSRSHSLVRLTVKAENLTNGTRTRSHLWLVDLAGSERVGKIEVEGERLKESQFINKSLSALGDVIAALASKNPHIPYRNSKLTHLLQSSLGGDCKTLMIVQISPSSADVGETLCSLNFATRVRGIEQGPARKQVDPAESFKLKQMAEKFRLEEKERARLKESLHVMLIKFGSRENIFTEKIKELENQLAEERRARQRVDNNNNNNKQEDADIRAYISKPPLPPPATWRRPPLARLSDNLPPAAPPKGGGAKAEEKENITTCQPMRARRILLMPVVRPSQAATCQPRRRASIAAMCQAAPPSVLRLPARRSSVAMALTTPKGKVNLRRSQFASPAPAQQAQQAQQAQLGKSRIPGVKLCYSIQKRLVVGSPGVKSMGRQEIWAGHGPLMSQPKEIVAKFGGARRVPVSDRRRSVL